MALGQEDRAVLTKAFQEAMPAIEAMVHAYCDKAGAPERFGIGLYDAAGAGPDSRLEAS